MKSLKQIIAALSIVVFLSGCLPASLGMEFYYDDESENYAEEIVIEFIPVIVPIDIPTYTDDGKVKYRSNKDERRLHKNHRNSYIERNSGRTKIRNNTGARNFGNKVEKSTRKRK